MNSEAQLEVGHLIEKNVSSLKLVTLGGDGMHQFLKFIKVVNCCT